VGTSCCAPNGIMIDNVATIMGLKQPCNSDQGFLFKP